MGSRYLGFALVSEENTKCLCDLVLVATPPMATSVAGAPLAGMGMCSSGGAASSKEIGAQGLVVVVFLNLKSISEMAQLATTTNRAR